MGPPARSSRLRTTPSQRRALRFSKRTEHTVCRTVRVLRVLQCADADGVLPGEQLPSVRWRDRGEEQRGEGAQGRSRRGRARLREGVRASASGGNEIRLDESTACMENFS